jgi:hypothetical protein
MSPIRVSFVSRGLLDQAPESLRCVCIRSAGFGGGGVRPSLAKKLGWQVPNSSNKPRPWPGGSGLPPDTSMPLRFCANWLVGVNRPKEKPGQLGPQEARCAPAPRALLAGPSAAAQSPLADGEVAFREDTPGLSAPRLMVILPAG